MLLDVSRGFLLMVYLTFKYNDAVTSMCPVIHLPARSASQTHNFPKRRTNLVPDRQSTLTVCSDGTTNLRTVFGCNKKE